MHIKQRWPYGASSDENPKLTPESTIGVLQQGPKLLQQRLAQQVSALPRTAQPENLGDMGKHMPFNHSGWLSTNCSRQRRLAACRP